MEVEVDVPGFGVCVVEVPDTEGDTVLVSSVCVKSTGEVVTESVFESGAIYQVEGKVREQVWDSEIDDKIDDIL